MNATHYTADPLPQANLWTHENLSAAAQEARRTARNTKSPVIRRMARNDAKAYHAELNRRHAETDDQAIWTTLNRYGTAGARALARNILQATTKNRADARADAAEKAKHGSLAKNTR